MAYNNLIFERIRRLFSFDSEYINTLNTFYGDPPSYTELGNNASRNLYEIYRRMMETTIAEKGDTLINTLTGNIRDLYFPDYSQILSTKNLTPIVRRILNNEEIQNSEIENLFISQGISAPEDLKKRLKKAALYLVTSLSQVFAFQIAKNYEEEKLTALLGQNPFLNQIGYSGKIAFDHRIFPQNMPVPAEFVIVKRKPLYLELKGNKTLGFKANPELTKLITAKGLSVGDPVTISFNRAIQKEAVISFPSLRKTSVVFGGALDTMMQRFDYGEKTLNPSQTFFLVGNRPNPVDSERKYLKDIYDFIIEAKNDPEKMEFLKLSFARDEAIQDKDFEERVQNFIKSVEKIEREEKIFSRAKEIKPKPVPKEPEKSVKSYTIPQNKFIDSFPNNNFSAKEIEPKPDPKEPKKSVESYTIPQSKFTDLFSDNNFSIENAILFKGLMDRGYTLDDINVVMSNGTGQSYRNDAKIHVFSSVNKDISSQKVSRATTDSTLRDFSKFVQETIPNSDLFFVSNIPYIIRQGVETAKYFPGILTIGSPTGLKTPLATIQEMAKIPYIRISIEDRNYKDTKDGNRLYAKDLASAGGVSKYTPAIPTKRNPILGEKNISTEPLQIRSLEPIKRQSTEHKQVPVVKPKQVPVVKPKQVPVAEHKQVQSVKTQTNVKIIKFEDTTATQKPLPHAERQIGNQTGNQTTRKQTNCDVSALKRKMKANFNRNNPNSLTHMTFARVGNP